MLIRSISLSLLLILVLCFSLTIGWDAQAQPPVNQHEIQGHSAQVVVDGISLFQVVGTSTFPAKRRAREISGRIKQLAADADFDPATLQLRDIEGATGIYAGDEVLMYVFEEDAYLERALSPRLIAQKVYLPKIADTIFNYRFEREPKVLLKHGLYSILRTVLLFISVWGVSGDSGNYIDRSSNVLKGKLTNWKKSRRKYSRRASCGLSSERCST